MSGDNLVNGTAWYNLTFAQDGVYTITVQCFDQANNNATATATSIYIDTTPPTCSVSKINEDANATLQFVSGTTIYYNNASGGQFTVNVSASDTTSGVKSVNYPATVSNAYNDTASPYSYQYNWSGASTYSSASTVTVIDNSNNTNTCSFTVTKDNTNASGGSLVFRDGYYNTTSVDITYTRGSDSGSGLNLSTGHIE